MLVFALKRHAPDATEVIMDGRKEARQPIHCGEKTKQRKGMVTERVCSNGTT